MFKNKTFNGDVPKATKWLYTSSGMFRDASYQFVAMFLLTFVQYCGLGNTTLGDYQQMYLVITIVVILLRIWDGFNDPIMGFIIEKCKFKSGKYRPWIFIGALTNCIVTICMFWILPTGWWYVALFCLFYFLWDLTYTINDIAFWSVLPSLSNNEKVRSNITTLLSIFVSIGSFAVGGIVPLLSPGRYEATYKITALVTSLLFIASQLILVIFMKEKEVSTTLEKNNENIKFKDIFTVLGKNSQVRSSIIAILFYYTGSTILVAAGLNYFYFNFGYQKGATYQLYFTIVYAAATLIGQFTYPLFINKLKVKRKKLFEILSFVTMISYLFLFCYVLIPDYEVVFPLLCIIAFFAFYGQTILSLILYIMIQDAIDYNQYKFGARRESAIFALRAFTAKITSSLQQLILYIFLLSGSLFGVSNMIATLERKSAVGGENIVEQAEEILSGIEQWQRIVFQIGFCIVPMLCFLACYLIIKFTYKIDEKYHEEIIKKIEAQNDGTSEETK